RRCVVGPRIGVAGASTVVRASSRPLNAGRLLGRAWTAKPIALDAPASNAFAAVGVVLIWGGLAVRVWAVLTLGRSFSTFIQVDPDQAVVTRGPYRWVRHPSYHGLLLIALGFGLGVGHGRAL